ncbi:DUF5069 domain-containing protein [bacterium]|nr:DUF5069 domain-containing protein [bacterium]
MNLDQVKRLAKDLRTDFPRSPAEPLADYAIAARALDKCRAEIAGWQGEYHYDCPLSRLFLDFAGISAEAFKAFVATGASDDEVADWIQEVAVKRDRIDIVRWSNGWREKRLSELDDRLVLHMEDYVQENLPPQSWQRIYRWFDIYDIEEKRIPV